jgi:2-dehydropantoate 2-reductase
MGNKIYIIGAGAVGKALAVFLKLEGKEVYIIRASIDNLPSLFETISIQMNDGTILMADIEVSSFSSYVNFDGILVLTNKSYGNNKIAEILENKAKNNPIILLQNGLGIENPFIEKGFTNLFRCVLFTTCQEIAPNVVKFKPVATSQIGIVNGPTEKLQFIADQLNNSLFHFIPNENIKPIIWKKAIANCVFNSICPLLETDNGIFIRDKNSMQLAEKVIAEGVKIANLSGIAITESEVAESVKMISKMSDGQLISTLQDIQNKRKTEIETLNFAVVAIAKKIGKEHEVIQTKLLGELTKIKADLNII